MCCQVSARPGQEAVTFFRQNFNVVPVQVADERGVFLVLSKIADIGRL